MEEVLHWVNGVRTGSLLGLEGPSTFRAGAARGGVLLTVGGREQHVSTVGEELQHTFRVDAVLGHDRCWPVLGPGGSFFAVGKHDFGPVVV